MALSYYLGSHGKSGRATQGAAGDAQKAPPPPSPEMPQNSLSHPPFNSAVFSGVVLLTRRTPFRARLFLPFLTACRREHPLLSSPLHSTPLHCCGERAKAGKARRGSRECLQAIREIISAVKESLFQGRVNLLFILAFAVRQD